MAGILDLFTGGIDLDEMKQKFDVAVNAFNEMNKKLEHLEERARNQTLQIMFAQQRLDEIHTRLSLAKLISPDQPEEVSHDGSGSQHHAGTDTGAGDPPGTDTGAGART